MKRLDYTTEYFENVSVCGRECEFTDMRIDRGTVPEGKYQYEVAYRIEKFHSGGKGGQNVNKVKTGVRIIHLPTGLTAQSTEERSQFQNKQRAMEKLREKLASLQQEQKANQVNAAWREHNRIVRGNPVRVYEGEKFVMKRLNTVTCAGENDTSGS